MTQTNNSATVDVSSLRQVSIDVMCQQLKYNLIEWSAALINVLSCTIHARAGGVGDLDPPQNPKYPTQTLARLGALAKF